jgi:hypothetical protein
VLDAENADPPVMPAISSTPPSVSTSPVTPVSGRTAAWRALPRANSKSATSREDRAHRRAPRSVHRSDRGGGSVVRLLDQTRNGRRAEVSEMRDVSAVRHHRLARAGCGLQQPVSPANTMTSWCSMFRPGRTSRHRVSASARSRRRSYQRGR